MNMSQAARSLAKLKYKGTTRSQRAAMTAKARAAALQARRRTKGVNRARSSD